MHVEELANDFGLSSPDWVPVSTRRLSQKVLLVLLSGRMWVVDDEGRRHDLAGPTWVVWYPGERLAYGAVGETVHWIFAQPTGAAPTGSPRPGSMVRVRGVDASAAATELGTLVHYIDESPDGSGPLDPVVDAARSGIGIYTAGDVVEVVEDADEDLHAWDFRVHDGRPVRRTRR